MDLHQMLKEVVERAASDLHLTAGVPPMVRLHGRISPLGDTPLLPTDTKSLAYSVLTDAQKQQFEEAQELDLSFGIKGLSRFRANVYMQRGAVGMAIRPIPYAIHTFEELGLSKVVAGLCEKPKGLILVTGPTGSGKSTTLATMIDKINRERHEHIVTIEDPIEFLHPHKSCI
ncbi:MAG: Flp pilus assembly complex ATPase component TadA, partial [candidate division NC10 bacterium]|nr:Flp pilus assembly complex ATPase component TadA [candidate division NC10 bacterium]